MILCSKLFKKGIKTPVLVSYPTSLLYIYKEDMINSVLFLSLKDQASQTDIEQFDLKVNEKY